MNLSINDTSHSISLIQSLEMFTYGSGFLLGLPTHTYIIWLIVTGSGIASEFFIFNLSVVEIGLSLDGLFFAIAIWFSTLWRLKYFFLGLSITGRPVFQCLMCVERFLAVVHPVTFLKLKPLRYRIFCCSVAWTFTIGSCLCSMFNAKAHLVIHMWVLSLQFFLFFFIQLFCCVSVLRALKQSGPGERKEENHMKRRAFLIILVTTVNMTLTYLPWLVLGLYSTQAHCLESCWMPGVLCFVLSGFVQPVLFLQRTGKLSCASSTKATIS